jgi:hypothetical protein
LPSGICRFIGQFFEEQFLPDNFCRFIGQNYENEKKMNIILPYKGNSFRQKFCLKGKVTFIRQKEIIGNYCLYRAKFSNRDFSRLQGDSSYL